MSPSQEGQKERARASESLSHSVEPLLLFQPLSLSSCHLATNCRLEKPASFSYSEHRASGWTDEQKEEINDWKREGRGKAKDKWTELALKNSQFCLKLLDCGVQTVGGKNKDWKIVTGWKRLLKKRERKTRRRQEFKRRRDYCKWKQTSVCPAESTQDFKYSLLQTIKQKLSSLVHFKFSFDISEVNFNRIMSKFYFRLSIKESRYTSDQTSYCIMCSTFLGDSIFSYLIMRNLKGEMMVYSPNSV